LAALQWSAPPIVGNDLVFAPVPNWRWRPWWILISFRVRPVTIERRHRPATPDTAITIARALAITIARGPITSIRVIAIVAAVVRIITVVTAVTPVAVAPFDIFAFDVATLIDQVPSARITS
jgi:hypothetical protein